VLWHCWLGGRKGIRPVKNWVVGCWRGSLGWGADLYITQQMPLPLTISCSSKSRLALIFLVLPFWYLLTRVVPDIFQKSSKTVVCVCVCTYLHFNNHCPVIHFHLGFPPSLVLLLQQNFGQYVAHIVLRPDVLQNRLQQCAERWKDRCRPWFA